MSSENSTQIINNKMLSQNAKRRDYLEWDEYFMAVAFLEQKKCPSAIKNDAAIVLNSRQIIIGMDHCSGDDDDSTDLFKHHAEYKLLRRIAGGVTMYTTSFPCEKCAEAIALSGISEIVYYEHYINSDKAKELLSKAQVTYRQFVSKREKIEIDFSKFCEDQE